MSAASYSSDVLEAFYGPIPYQHKYQLKKGAKTLTPSDERQTSIFHISEAIQNLPPELLEKIYKEYAAIKLRERKEMGWDEVHYVIEEMSFCEKRLRIVYGFFCYECDVTIRRNGMYSVCL